MKKRILYGLSIFILICISISSLPLSLLHHHDHKNECDVTSSLPTKLKKDKDLYPKHYHSHADECFLCFNSHFSSAKENTVHTKAVLFSNKIVFIERILPILSHPIIELKGRGPPSKLYC
jgi:hypothetical protein